MCENLGDYYLRVIFKSFVVEVLVVKVLYLWDLKVMELS